VQFTDLKTKIVRYLLIDIERISIDVPAPNRVRIRIQGATSRQCEYIWDCLAPDLPGIDLTVEGGGFGGIPDRARWPLMNAPLAVPASLPYAWGAWSMSSMGRASMSRMLPQGYAPSPMTSGRRSVFWELAASGCRRA
jgi:hypothetical protein